MLKVALSCLYPASILALFICKDVFILNLEKKKDNVISVGIDSMKKGDRIGAKIYNIRHNLYLFVISYTLCS